MDTVKLDKGNIKMIAHRGASAMECENTCAAFIFASARTYYGIESDVYITKDGKYVMAHDRDLYRVTGGENGGQRVVIEDSTYEELSKYRFYSPYSHETRSDYFLPTLEDYIKICHRYDKEAILEIKTAFSVEEIRKMVDIISEIGHLERTTFISFVEVALVNLREVLPNHKAQYLVWGVNQGILDFMDKYNFDLDINMEGLTAEWAEKVQDHGHKINVWTVNELEDAEKMKALGVDFITTNTLE